MFALIAIFCLAVTACADVEENSGDYGDLLTLTDFDSAAIMTDKQMDDLNDIDDDDDDDDDDGSSFPIMRNAIASLDRRWPGAIVPYTISNEFNQDQRRTIASAMQAYAAQTCIRFTPASNADSNYIGIQLDSVCNSKIGRIGGYQALKLTSTCANHKGKVMHELMHALGFVHEHNRYDRDNYITVMFDNVKSGKEGNFNKLDQSRLETYGTQYDYASLMHYGSHIFSRNRQPTIITKQNAQIGQRSGFSQTDLFKLNKMYQCSTTSEITEPVATEKPVEPTRCTDNFGVCSMWGSGRCRQKMWRRNCKYTCNAC